MTKRFGKICACPTIAFWLLFGTVSSASAQTGPQPLAQGTIVTGQCYGHESEPGCVLPNLFGSQGLSLFPNPQVPHYAHFIGSAQQTLNQTLGTAIATQLAILPIISPASGFTYKYDPGTGAFERSTTTFGPIYTERAETIGKGKVYFGVSYQRFRFDKLDGIDLHNVPSVFSHIEGTGPNGARQIFENDVIRASNNVTFNMDQTVLFGTVGLNDRIDASIAIPIVSARMGASSSDQIIRVSGPNFVTPTGMTVGNPHQFTSDPNSLTNVYNATPKGSATGIGDITIRLKGNVMQGEAVRVAIGLDFRVPTGDARQLLGSGSTGIKPFVAISAGRRVSPHVNIGYQYNGSSILAGNLTGTTVFEGLPPNSTSTTPTTLIQNGPATTGHVPGNLFFAGGADIGLTSRVTLAFDYLGQTVFNAPRVFATNFTTANIPGGTGAISLPTIEGRKETMTLSSGAAGVKVNLFGGLLLTADVLFRLDDNGLRQNVTPLIGLSRAFGK